MAMYVDIKLSIPGLLKKNAIFNFVHSRELIIKLIRVSETKWCHNK